MSSLLMKRSASSPARQGVKVAMVGGEGSFSAVASNQYFSESKGNVVQPFLDFTQVFINVANGQSDYGIVPIENNVSGTMFEVYSLLLTHPTVHITGEIALNHEYCLLVLPGVKQEDIRQIISHARILQQCSQFLATFSSPDIPVVQRIVPNTIAACELLVTHDLKDGAVIASFQAGQRFNLQVLVRNISIPQEVVTRYFVIAMAPAHVLHLTSSLKCSIAVTISNLTGAFFKTTACFALRDVNISKFECAPAPPCRLKPSNPFKQAFTWEYIFFIDFEPPSPSVSQLIIKHLEEYALSVKQFGLYQPQPYSSEGFKLDWTAFI